MEISLKNRYNEDKYGGVGRAGEKPAVTAIKKGRTVL